MKTIQSLALIDDDDVFIYLTRKVIEKTNRVTKIQIFEDGNSALEYLQANIKSHDLLPDVLLLDLNMPLMNGWQFLEAYEKVRVNLKKKIVIYIYSSSISPQDFQRAKEIETVREFIVKPLSFHKILEIVDNY